MLTWLEAAWCLHDAPSWSQAQAQGACRRPQPESLNAGPPISVLRRVAPVVPVTAPVVTPVLVTTRCPVSLPEQHSSLSAPATAAALHHHPASQLCCRQPPLWHSVSEDSLVGTVNHKSGAYSPVPVPVPVPVSVPVAALVSGALALAVHVLAAVSVGLAVPLGLPVPESDLQLLQLVPDGRPSQVLLPLDVLLQRQCTVYEDHALLPALTLLHRGDNCGAISRSKALFLSGSTAYRFCGSRMLRMAGHNRTCLLPSLLGKAQQYACVFTLASAPH